MSDDYTCHVHGSTGRSLCGIKHNGTDWWFQSRQHAINSSKQGSRLIPCKKCMPKTIKTAKLEELRYICLLGDREPSLLTLDEYVSDMVELQSPVSAERLAKDWQDERPIYYRLID